MAQTDRQRWDARYREGAYGQRLWPSAYLEQCMPRLTPAQSGARALDVACGRGRNSLYLAQQGFAVEAVDVSSVAIAHGATRALQAGLAINWRCQDLQGGAASWHPQGTFGLIIMFRYVASPLLPILVEHLAPGGHLLVEEHMQWAEAETLSGPSNPAFRVTSTELKQALAPASANWRLWRSLPESSTSPMAVERLWRVYGCAVQHRVKHGTSGAYSKFSRLS